jgi:hypothetical protein
VPENRLRSAFAAVLRAFNTDRDLSTSNTTANVEGDMSTEKRTHPRVESRYTAWIEVADGSPARECILRDISDDGAKLGVKVPDQIPQEFMLRLTVDGTISYRCRVVWRSDENIGVGFVPTP